MSKQVTQSANVSDDQNLIDKFLELRDSYKKKKCFNDDDIPVLLEFLTNCFQQLKIALKDIPQLRDIALGIRNETLGFYDVIELKQNEILVKKDNPNVSIYILVSGKLKKSVHAPWNTYKEDEDRLEQDMITLRQNFQEFEGLQAFGNFDLLQIDKFNNSQKWNSCYVYSISQSLVLALNFDKTYKYMEKLFENQQQHEKQNFLVKNVPGLSNQLTSNREKMIQLFKPISFIQNQTIIAEGTIPQMAYIIVEGHCKLQSNQIPIQKSISNEDPKKAENFVSQNRGYFSKTMNTFQIGIISENQWIGEELLIMSMQERYDYLQQQVSTEDTQSTSNQTMSKSQWNFNLNDQSAKQKPKQQQNQQGMSYSVIAKTNIQAYCITKDDLMQKLSKEIQVLINKQAVKKQDWVQRRFREIQIDVKKVFGMEQSYQNYVDKSKELGKIYPQATKYSLKTISHQKINSPIKYSKDEEIQNPVIILYQTLQTEVYYNKGMLNTQTMNFSKMKKSTSVQVLQRSLNPESRETSPNTSLQKITKLCLPAIQENYEQFVSHSDTIKFHNNPFVAQSPSKTDQKRSRRKLEQLSVSDKISNQLTNDVNHNDLSQRNSMNFERIIMGAASCYNYTQQKKLYLPTLIKNIEIDKKMLIVNKSKQNTGSGRVSVDIESLKTGQLDIKNTNKRIQFDDKDFLSKRNSSISE